MDMITTTFHLVILGVAGFGFVAILIR